MKIYELITLRAIKTNSSKYKKIMELKDEIGMEVPKIYKQICTDNLSHHLYRFGCLIFTAPTSFPGIILPYKKINNHEQSRYY